MESKPYRNHCWRQEQNTWWAHECILVRICPDLNLYRVLYSIYYWNLQVLQELKLLWSSPGLDNYKDSETCVCRMYEPCKALGCLAISLSQEFLLLASTRNSCCLPGVGIIAASLGSELLQLDQTLIKKQSSEPRLMVKYQQEF